MSRERVLLPDAHSKATGYLKKKKPDPTKNMYQIAQEITDKFMGKGTYVRVNGFDPSKGETHRG